MNSSMITKFEEFASNHPNTAKKHIGYGTAGFRDKAVVLDHVMFRVGILAALRSKVKQATIGVVITASHNPEEDNGVKLVDPEGEMLENSWEKIATDIANIEGSKLLAAINELIIQFKIDLTVKGSVFVGRDTRQSSPALRQSVLDGTSTISDTEVTDFGLASTPILHYLVVCKNGNENYGKCSKEGYYSKLNTAFLQAQKNIHPKKTTNYTPFLTVDCANGIGALELAGVTKNGTGLLDITPINNGEGVLNHNCGADFVKVQQTYPENVIPTSGKRYASLDGDADRLIYFYFDERRTFHMLDGDKISLLLAEHLSHLATMAGLKLVTGVVQTAYANGSSTKYAKEILGIPVACVPTGVKHLHHAAKEFDIGVYFEANGHGTVIFSDTAVQTIRQAASTSASSLAAKELECFLDLINSTVGDAISDLLSVEAVLLSKGWSAEDWDRMYHDLPNRQLKVSVRDRIAISTADAERVALTPSGLQNKIISIVGKYKEGRSFVRPSGTEDIVRVYAEAVTQENADSLAKEVALAVYELCEGVGPKP